MSLNGLLEHVWGGFIRRWTHGLPHFAHYSRAETGPVCVPRHLNSSGFYAYLPGQGILAYARFKHVQKETPKPPTGAVSNRSPNPAMMGRAFAIASCTCGNDNEAL